MNHDALTLRPARDEDMEFLMALYASVREDELRQVPWTPEQKAAFIAQQFHAQHTYWHDSYPNTSWDLILLDGQPVGRLYVARWADEIRIIDIALLPAQRGAGIGSRLLGEILAQADAAGQKVCIHVEAFNPARRLYQRMGFLPRGETGIYQFMERPPVSNSPAVT